MPGADLSDNRRRSPRARRPNRKNNLLFATLIGVSAVCIVVAAAISIPIISASPKPDTEGTEIVSESLPAEVIEESDKIYDNIFVNNIAVSGLTKEEATEKLTKELDKTLESQKNLVYEDMKFTYALKDLKAQYDIKAAVNASYAIGREGSKEEQKRQIEEAKTKKVELEAELNFDNDYIASIIDTISEDINIEPTNAKVERVNGEFIITPEVSGLIVNKEATLENLFNAIKTKSTADVPIEVSKMLPEYTKESLANATKLIGSYSTTVSGSAAGRNKNLDTAVSKINNYVVYPGEVFSTNAAFGEMSERNGYRMAPVIVGGELINGMGGGVCQISSTLYMALLHAELEIVERRNHSQKVGYSDYGYDATLAGDYIDLKFRNNTEAPLTIVAYIEGSKAYVNLYGQEIHEEGRRLEFYNKLVDTIPAPEETIIQDPELPLGARNVTSSAKNGVHYELHKIVYSGNTEISREKINNSKYSAKGAIVRVGTGAAAAEPSPSPEETPAPSESPAPPPAQESPAPEQPAPKPEEATPLPEPPAEEQNTEPVEPAPVEAYVPSVSNEPPPIVVDPAAEEPAEEQPPIGD